MKNITYGPLRKLLLRVKLKALESVVAGLPVIGTKSQPSMVFCVGEEVINVFHQCLKLNLLMEDQFEFWNSTTF